MVTLPSSACHSTEVVTDSLASQPVSPCRKRRPRRQRKHRPSCKSNVVDVEAQPELKIAESDSCSPALPVTISREEVQAVGCADVVSAMDPARLSISEHDCLPPNSSVKIVEPRAESCSAFGSPKPRLLGGRILGYYVAPPSIEAAPPLENISHSPTKLRESAQLPRKDSRSVRFHHECLVYEVTPYAEIYGVHPREFVFEKDYAMVPAVGCADIGNAWRRRRAANAVQSVEDEEDYESDTEDFEGSEWDVEYTI